MIGLSYASKLWTTHKHIRKCQSLTLILCLPYNIVLSNICIMQITMHDKILHKVVKLPFQPNVSQPFVDFDDWTISRACCTFTIVLMQFFTVLCCFFHVCCVFPFLLLLLFYCMFSSSSAFYFIFWLSANNFMQYYILRTYG